MDLETSRALGEFVSVRHGGVMETTTAETGQTKPTAQVNTSEGCFKKTDPRVRLW